MESKLPRSKDWALAASLALTLLYGLSVFGLFRPDTVELFKSLTPLTLMASAVILFAFQKKWSKKFLYFLLGTFLAGWLVHLLGYHSGFPFGNYQYGPSLGFRIAGVPIIMGVLWVILVYCAGSITRKIPMVKVGKAMIGALLIVLMDVTIEPAALRYDFWDWYGQQVPLVNYIAWFVISFIMLIIFHLTRFRKSNLVAPWLYITMLSFFTALNWFN